MTSLLSATTPPSWEDIKTAWAIFDEIISVVPVIEVAVKAWLLVIPLAILGAFVLFAMDLAKE